ncbi:hypothetical protein [Psychrobacter jeotgali]|uniref:hypothetical protein n=1 Tax=Psychrobacter jeotgali TaxID=179010 RepID=UPI00191B3085|nr:hypothetical protein [Psychrobacter jeotgali]
MSLGSLKKLQKSMVITSLLAGAMTISACQQQEPEASVDDSINSEESVPMSAEPAEPTDTAIAVDDTTFNEVGEDTVASVNTSINQVTYLCSPEFKVEATYNDDSNEVILGTTDGTVTLVQTNDGTNPEVFEVQTALDGGEGFTQWRVAHERRETGVMRTAGAGAADPDVYECKKTQ